MTTIIDAHLIGIATDQHPIALVVTMEDEQLHTDAHPFCNDLTCPCHEVRDPRKCEYPPYYWEHLEAPYRAGLYSLEEVGRIFHNDHL